MIVADTSVWIDAFHSPASHRAHTLRQLLDADEIALPLPVRLELMSGVARKDRNTFRRGLSALPVLTPSDETWRVIETWVEPAADAGMHFAITDLLIAALAHEITGLVWSLDAAFRNMEGSGWCSYTGERAMSPSAPAAASIQRDVAPERGSRARTRCPCLRRRAATTSDDPTRVPMPEPSPASGRSLPAS